MKGCKVCTTPGCGHLYMPYSSSRRKRSQGCAGFCLCCNTIVLNKDKCIAVSEALKHASMEDGGVGQVPGPSSHSKPPSLVSGPGWTPLLVHEDSEDDGCASQTGSKTVHPTQPHPSVSHPIQQVSASAQPYSLLRSMETAPQRSDTCPAGDGSGGWRFSLAQKHQRKVREELYGTCFLREASKSALGEVWTGAEVPPPTRLPPSAPASTRPNTAPIIPPLGRSTDTSAPGSFYGPTRPGEQAGSARSLLAEAAGIYGGTGTTGAGEAPFPIHFLPTLASKEGPVASATNTFAPNQATQMPKTTAPVIKTTAMTVMESGTNSASSSGDSESATETQTAREEVKKYTEPAARVPVEQLPGTESLNLKEELEQLKANMAAQSRAMAELQVQEHVS